LRGVAHQMTRFLLAALAGVFIPAGASAATWYVGKTGSDSNSCTQAQSPNSPKLTIPAGLACIGTAPSAGAGHTVEVAAGTYAEAIRNTLPSGSSWASPFTLRAKAGNVVTIRAAGESNIFLAGTGTPAMYSIIEGFVLDGTYLSNNQITLNGPRFVRLTNLKIVNTTNWNAIYTGYSSNLEIIGNEIHDGTFLPTGFGHALYIEGSDNLIEGNLLYNLPAFGVHIYSSDSRPSNNIVRRNTVHDFGLNRESASGILLSSGSNNQAYNNIVFNGRGSSGSGGVGIGASGTSPVVFNNTVYNNTWSGIDTDGSTGAVIKNNIVYGNGIAFNNSGGGSMVSNNLTTDPKFQNVAAGNFALQAGSSAIDAGTASITSTIRVISFVASAPDIGAIEYGGDHVPQLPTAPTNVRLVALP
jgi:parallel beta-helix repeat protein